MCNSEYVTIDVDMDNRTLELLEWLSEETGFTIDKIVEYSLANKIIEEALTKRKNVGVG